MSSGVFKGNASGTGVVTLETPNTNSDITIALPARAGNLMMDGPAFFAYASSSQSITSNTRTKIQYNNELWDTNNCYDPTTNYRFTPNVAGYYAINATVTFGEYAANFSEMFIYKNGTNVSYSAAQRARSTNYNVVSISSLVYCNGTTDYIEIYANEFGATSSTIVQSSPLYFTYWSGALIRGA